MTVLHFLKTGGYSGAENVVITIISKMKDIYNIRGIYVSPKGIVDDILNENEIEHAVLDKNSVKEYQRIIDLYKPDIIHAHDFFTSVLVSFTRSDAKIISHLHNNPTWFRAINIKSVLYRMRIDRFKSILGVSGSVFEEYVFAKKICKKGIVVGNPVDINRVQILSEIATEWEESDVLFLGRLSEPKNPLRFINIVNALKNKYDGIKALMVGDGELRDECISSIDSLQLTDSIKLKGFKKNPYGYLKNTKVLCVPSVWEGFGLVVVEALSLGIPVVATPVGGMKNMVTDEVGRLSDNDQEMSEEIIRLLVDDEYYMKKSIVAKEHAKKLSNIEAYMENIRSVYLD